MCLKRELYDLIRTDESIFDFIQDSALDGLWYWDLEHPGNEWMNARFWTVLGYNPDEMPHKSNAWQDIINQDDLKVAFDNFYKHCENPKHPYDQVVRYTHKNGSTFYFTLPYNTESATEATRHIRAFNKEVVIIAQTADGLYEDRQKSIQSGCNDYIAKPFSSKELHGLIKKYFG